MRGTMWTLQIAGIELYFLLGWFWIYCFLGWVWESCYMSVVEGHPVNSLRCCPCDDSGICNS